MKDNTKLFHAYLVQLGIAQFIKNATAEEAYEATKAHLRSDAARAKLELFKLDLAVAEQQLDALWPVYDQLNADGSRKGDNYRMYPIQVLPQFSNPHQAQLLTTAPEEPVKAPTTRRRRATAQTQPE